MAVTLNKSWDAYVAKQVDSGKFESDTDVVQDALKLQQERDEKLAYLRQEIQKGLDDIEAGRISYATADEIIAKARARMGLK